MTRRRLITSCSIILVSMGLGAVVAFVLSWSLTLFHQEPPMRLSSLSIRADIVLGVETSGFFSAVPIIRAKDGQLYEYDLYEKQFIPLNSLPEDLRDTACQPEYVLLLEKVAGKVASCREVEPFSEYCAAPDTVFANTLEGELWMYRNEQLYGFTTVILTILLVPVGLLLGFVIALARKSDSLVAS